MLNGYVRTIQHEHVLSGDWASVQRDESNAGFFTGLDLAVSGCARKDQSVLFC